MGLIQLGASLARVVVPLFLATIYQDKGLYFFVLVIVSFTMLSLILTSIAYKQLVPKDEQSTIIHVTTS